MRRPNCRCFRGPYPSDGDQSTDLFGGTFFTLYSQYMEEFRICDKAVEHVTQAVVTGLLTAAAIRMLKASDPNTPDVYKLAQEMADRTAEAVRERIAFGTMEMAKRESREATKQ